ncbi:MAG: PAS domain-containing protein [Prolixibacteraceae bacterium]|nr:PAS domain-containing protein [Prolixibacteraceae bacterium]MBT6764368.1 PAS domain-containing protein [Prolixibacteraceae bacterium]MBT7000631.1 PAS domain-containing protein [Prolixibacteraceae bacterium]MBT7396200.1 PAS domain-containing protein [Prolixibacteraceae bacterium]
MEEHKKIEERFEALNQVPIGMFVLREDFVILFWNQCIADWSGISQEAIVGDVIFDKFPDLNKPKYTSRIKMIFEGGAPTILSSQLHRYIIPCLLPDESYRFQHTTVTSIPANDGKTNYALFAIEDVTDLTKRIRESQNLHKMALEEVATRKKAENELNAAVKELLSFSYTVSHDLKTPLRGILGYTHELNKKHRENLSERGKFCTDQIKNAAQNLNGLIDELLKYSRVGGQQVSFTNISMRKIIDTLISERNQLIEEKGVIIETDISFDNIITWGTGVILMLSNIIDNAIKYSSNENPPIIKVIGVEHAGHYSLTVIDNGIGFNMKYQNKMYGLFNRLVGDHEFEGTGAGLAIVKKILDKLGGKIWAESELGKGASFFVEIPKTEIPIIDKKGESN